MFLILLFPLLGSVILSFFRYMPRWLATTFGVGSIALSAITVGWFDFAWLCQAHGNPWNITIWNWIGDARLHIPFELRLDGLSLTMISVVTGIGFLIHVFAAWYMTEDQEANPHYLYTRFFAYMNLFIFSMLSLVLGANMFVLFLGWEGVGVCSYLLIGYYHRDPNNTWAAYKAFIMTRLGDVFLAIAMMILWESVGTLDMYELLSKAPLYLMHHSLKAEIIGFLILGGAVGKSAQIPLQTWLADAMAGPTPVSALIHAATMVTAGVYLIARLHSLYDVAPIALNAVAIIGSLTLLMAGFSALAQTDIKRILAYSTMSQIGYMFVALGVGAWRAAIFHLMIHAFFKALLFLASGSVIVACHHEQNIYKMGGLARPLRLSWLSFIVGGAALSALPFVTSGFYSKDTILWFAFASGHIWLWLAGVVGAFLTSLYTFRLIFVVFYGKQHHKVIQPRGWMHAVPLMSLGLLSTALGALFSLPLQNVLPALKPHITLNGAETVLTLFSSIIALSGVLLAALLFCGRRRLIIAITNSRTGRRLWMCFHHAFWFESLYHVMFVRPFLFLTQAHHFRWLERFGEVVRGGALAWPHRGHQADWIDVMADFFPITTQFFSRALSATQNGFLRHYVATFIAGATLIIVLLMVG